MNQQYGFVYILGNRSMPGLVKIGFTERSPHLRAAELSKATGVPDPFFVYGYVETENARKLEAELHARFFHSRVEGKEFFYSSFSTVWMTIREEFDSNYIIATLCLDGAEELFRAEAA